MFKSQISTILRLDAQSRKYFRGVYAIDELNSSHLAINEQPNDQLWLTTTTTATASDAAVRSGTAGGAFVVNYDESNKPGSHWVGVFRDEQGHVDFFPILWVNKEVYPKSILYLFCFVFLKFTTRCFLIFLELKSNEMSSNTSNFIRATYDAFLVYRLPPRVGDAL